METDYAKIRGEHAYQSSASFLHRLCRLHDHHTINCDSYRMILEAMRWEGVKINQITDAPFLPTRVFKSYKLCSVPEREIFKTLHSSGTSSQTLSNIYLDRDTAKAQAKSLYQVVSGFLNIRRGPMIVLDSPKAVGKRDSFTARGAGIKGFSMFASERIFAFNEDMTLNKKLIDEFLEKHSEEKIFLFGFTFVIYQYFIEVLRAQGKQMAISNGTLLHGGGWKKINDLAISNLDFKSMLDEVARIKNVYNYYGMVEQTGSISIECEAGFLHAPEAAKVIIRDPKDFQPMPLGATGIIQSISLLPKSYPGHSLLTEDVGTVWGNDNCVCGRMGSYFSVKGRLKAAEVRGCSDTHG